MLNYFELAYFFNILAIGFVRGWNMHRVGIATNSDTLRSFPLNYSGQVRPRENATGLMDVCVVSPPSLETSTIFAIYVWEAQSVQSVRLPYSVTRLAKCQNHRNQQLCTIFRAWVNFLTEHTVFCHKLNLWSIFCSIFG